MTKKEFALKAIKPYYDDPSTCGFEGNSCVYQTGDGRKCIAGKFMLNPANWSEYGTISSILSEYTQKEIFVPEAVGVLEDKEWGMLQTIHDNIAISGIENLEPMIEQFGLFTLQELKDFKY